MSDSEEGNEQILYLGTYAGWGYSFTMLIYQLANFNIWRFI